MDGEVSFVVGMANPRASTHRYTLGLPVAAPASVAVNRLVPVLAADGQLVFDAIEEPAASGYDLGAESALYVLVRVKAVGKPGPLRIEVTDDTGWKSVLGVDIQVLDRIRPGPADQPRVLVWTYTNDKPIWRRDNAGSMAANLAAAGVNVVDIHPAHIPAPLEEDEWPARIAALKSDLALFRGKAMALLFLGGAPWEKLASLPEDPGTQRRLARWVGVLTEVMRGAGYSRDDWALYLIDEPHGDDLSRLAAVISRLRAIDQDLRFYANPTIGRGQKITSIPALWRLKGLVDYWQPRAGDAFETVASIVGTSNRSRLWVYDNPREPARSASPACYRVLGRRAFDAGAGGMGFWSFSSTNDSSAWSDYDGNQPDWAVVYEAESGFVSSRRWEAFKQGVRDFSVLSFCARTRPDDPATGAQCATYRAAIDAGLPDDCAD